MGAEIDKATKSTDFWTVTLEAVVLNNEHYKRERDNYYTSHTGYDAGILWVEYLARVSIRLTDNDQKKGFSLNSILYCSQVKWGNNDKDKIYDVLATLNVDDIIRFSIKRMPMGTYYFYGEESFGFGDNANFSTPANDSGNYLGEETRCALKKLERKIFSYDSTAVDAEIICDLKVLKRCES